MKEKGIKMILIQIDEAHSTAWPIGLENPVTPQKDFNERVERANNFVKTENPPFTVFIDEWNNTFAEKFKAWPDKYYCINEDKKIIAKSTYGLKSDALIDVDCVDLIIDLLEK